MTEAAHVELNRVIEALAGEFADVFCPEAVAAFVLDGYQGLEPARVATFLPLLSHRFVRERPWACAPAQGKSRRPRRWCCSSAPTTPVDLKWRPPCWPRRRATGSPLPRPERRSPARASRRWCPPWPRSASTPPTPPPSHSPKRSSPGPDVVVTMGCCDAGRVLPGRRYLDWEPADSRGADPETVRGIRDDIDARVHALAAELVPTPVEVTP